MRSALVCVAMLGCGGTQATTTSPDTLDGLWGGDLPFDTGPHGALEVEHRGDGWHAKLGGADAALAPMQPIGTEALLKPAEMLDATFGKARLRVQITTAGVVGHWIQPETDLDGRFATPLAFARVDADHYRATVEPMPSVLHFYVRIDGQRAFVREPSRNLGKQLGALAVETHGRDVTFRDAKGKLVASATRGDGRLQLRLIDAELTIPLAKLDRANAPWFYARAPGPVQLAPVAAGSDGWRVATPEAAGFDPEALRAIVTDLAADVPDGPNTRAVHALVIAHRGALVVEEYFAGHRADALHDLRSAGKSISTTLAGIAIAHGQLALHDPLYDTVGYAADDPRKKLIQLVHLVTMATGLACDDGDDNSPGNEDTMQAQKAQPDWYRYTLDLPVKHPPGTGFYCSGTMNLVGAMVAARTHRWLPEALRDELFAPLGIAHYAIPVMPDEQGYFGGGIRLRARDFAKLAQLFVDDGRWNGVPIVDPAWVRDATAAHIGLNKPGDYGYGWWRQHYSLDGQELDAYFASGNGGQIAMAIPKLALVVAFQSGNYNARGIWQHQIDDIVPRIIRALR